MRNQIRKARQAIAQLGRLPPQLRVEDEPRVGEHLGVEDTGLVRAEEPVIGAQERAECIKGRLRVGVDVVGEEERAARGAQDLGGGGLVEGLADGD